MDELVLILKKHVVGVPFLHGNVHHSPVLVNILQLIIFERVFSCR